MDDNHSRPKFMKHLPMIAAGGCALFGFAAGYFVDQNGHDNRAALWFGLFAAFVGAFFGSVVADLFEWSMAKSDRIVMYAFVTGTALMGSAAVYVSFVEFVRATSPTERSRALLVFWSGAGIAGGVALMALIAKLYQLRRSAQTPRRDDTPKEI